MPHVEVRLTQEHIDAARRDDSDNCPGELAIVEVLGLPSNRILVRPHAVVLYLEGDYLPPLLVETPKALKTFIDDFDSDRPVSPITFTLDLPPDLAAMARRVEQYGSPGEQRETA